MTIFTARWTYRIFAHEKKIQELKELRKTIELLHWRMEIFCAQVRDAPVLDEKEMGEKIELAQFKRWT